MGSELEDKLNMLRFSEEKKRTYEEISSQLRREILELMENQSLDKIEGNRIVVTRASRITVRYSELAQELIKKAKEEDEKSGRAEIVKNSYLRVLLEEQGGE